MIQCKTIKSVDVEHFDADFLAFTDQIESENKSLLLQFVVPVYTAIEKEIIQTIYYITIDNPPLPES